MTEMKAGYKKTDIGLIPEDWNIDQIKNVCQITTGDKNTQDKIDSGRYPFFVRSQNVERINSYSFDGEAVLTAGDGVGTGKIFHYINGKFDFHQRVYKMSHFNKRIDGFYFYKYFSNNFYARIMSMTAKSSVDSVRMEMIANMEIPLPKPEEQKAIAAALSDVDGLIESLEKLIAKKRDMKTAAMQQLLTGKKRLPGFDGEWEKKSFDDLFLFLSTANNSRADLSEAGDVKYIHYGDIHTKWSDYVDFRKHTISNIHKEKVLNASYLKNGDLIIADASEDYEGVAKSVEVMGLIDEQLAVAGLHTYLLRQKNSSDLSDGFKAYIQHIPSVKLAIQRVATGLKVYGISKNNLRDVLVLLPKKDEQREIATVLSDMESEIDALEQRLEKARSLKTGMMQELLTGKTRLLKTDKKQEVVA